MGAYCRPGDEHLAGIPLRLFHDIQAAVQDELVHVARRLGETGHAVATLLRRAELILEQWVILRPDNGEVVGHG